MPMFQKLFGAEWRDPEDVSFAITASRPSHQTAGGNGSTPAGMFYQQRLPFACSHAALSRNTTANRDNAREELQDRQGWCAGIPPLRAIESLVRPRFGWRSGRDDNPIWFSRRMGQ